MQPMLQSICVYVCVYVCFGPYATSPARGDTQQKSRVTRSNNTKRFLQVSTIWTGQDMNRRKFEVDIILSNKLLSTTPNRINPHTTIWRQLSERPGHRSSNPSQIPYHLHPTHIAASRILPMKNISLVRNRRYQVHTRIHTVVVASGSCSVVCFHVEPIVPAVVP